MRRRERWPDASQACFVLSAFCCLRSAVCCCGLRSAVCCPRALGHDNKGAPSPPPTRWKKKQPAILIGGPATRALSSALSFSSRRPLSPPSALHFSRSLQSGAVAIVAAGLCRVLPLPLPLLFGAGGGSCPVLHAVLPVSRRLWCPPDRYLDCALPRAGARPSIRPPVHPSSHSRRGRQAKASAKYISLSDLPLSRPVPDSSRGIAAVRQATSAHAPTHAPSSRSLANGHFPCCGLQIAYAPTDDGNRGGGSHAYIVSPPRSTARLLFVPPTLTIALRTIGYLP